MAFQLIDLENWERREFYEHFIKEVVCTYSVVVNIDITNLKGQKLYPAMIWLLTKTVNDMPEFRTSLTPEGLGIYDDMHPMYTVFNKENKNFSGIWAYFSEDYETFLMTLHFDDDEQHIPRRLEREKRNGRVELVDQNTCKKMCPERTKKYNREIRIAMGHLQTVQYITCLTI